MHIKDWLEEAACSGIDFRLFFVRKKKEQEFAKSICEGCPVINECRKWATDNEMSGIWGGMTAYERARQ